MKNLTDKLKKYKGAIILGTATAAIISGLAIGNSIKSYGSGQEVFQGYNIADEGRIAYVFDPESKTERGFRTPKYRIYGNPSLTDSLKIGKSYRFTTIKRSLPWSKKHIESIIPYNPKNSKNELR